MILACIISSFYYKVIIKHLYINKIYVSYFVGYVYDLGARVAQTQYWCTTRSNI